MPAPIFSITVLSKAAKSIDSGAHWLSEKDISGWKPAVAGIAAIYDRRGKFIATAFASPRSQYFLRIISRRNEKIDIEFWRARISRANARRAALTNATNAYRAIYSEADGMPSVIVDKFNDILAVQITSAGAESAKAEILAALKDELSPSAIVEKNNCAARKAESLSLEDKIVFGSKTQTEICELDQKFIVDVMNGQKTGAYLDYRSIRLAARDLARGNCLDLFSYEGWLSCHIARFAEKVVAVDASKEAIAAAKKNAALNSHDNISFISEDAFEFIKNCKGKFDFIHIDPPAMAKKQKDLMPAISGYKKLLASALAISNDGAVIMISSCSHRISERILEETVLSSVKKHGRKCAVIWRGIQDKDHPIARGLPESLYLKAIAVRLE